MRFDYKKLCSDLTNNLSRLSIRVKLTIALLSCAIFTPIVLIAYTVILEEQTLLEQRRQEIQHHLETESQLINNLLDTASRDVVFLSQIPAIKIFSSTHFSARRKALETRMLEQFSKISSSEVFFDFLRTNPLYQQLTYLDINGIERLRIDQQQGAISLIDDELLVDQSNQPYFNDTMVLPEGKVYISEIELYDLQNPDGNAINPVIRLATQVYDKSENLQGMLVINVSGKNLLNIIQNTISKNSSIFLIDSDGFYLTHPDTNKSWSKLRGNQYTLQTDFPSLNNLPERLSDNNLRHILTQGNEVFFSPITPEFDKLRKWYIVEIIPSILFLDSTRFYVFIIFLISIISIFFSGDF